MNASNMANLRSVVVAFAVLFVSTLATKYKPGDKVCSHDYKLNYLFLLTCSRIIVFTLEMHIRHAH